MNTKAIIEGQLRECYGRVVYSHKTHEKCCDILLLRLRRIKFWQVVLSVLTTSGFVGTMVSSNYLFTYAGGLASTILLILNAYVKNYDLGEIAQKHKQAADDIWLIREKYLSLLTDVACDVKSVDIITKERDSLLKELHAIYCGSPSTNYEAYKKAQNSLQYQDDMTFSDSEIDAFLPGVLKKTK